MTRRLSGFLLGSALVLLVAGRVEAASITFDPADVLMTGGSGSTACTGNVAANTTSGAICSSLAFTYTLPGFSSLTDTITSGTLALTFYDDNGPGNSDVIQTEIVNISLDGLLTLNSPLTITNGSTAGSPFSASYSVIAQLQDNGQLSVLLAPSTLTGNANDFSFAQSVLSAEFREGDTLPLAAVPEPGSMILLGTGLAGLVAYRMRRKRA